jgi:hypothetical protein
MVNTSELDSVAQLVKAQPRAQQQDSVARSVG